MNPPLALVAPAPAPANPRLVVLQYDGTREGEHPLREGDNVVGRDAGGLLAQDRALSALHATLTLQHGTLTVRDAGGRNGSFFRLPPRVATELKDGDQFFFGRIVLQFEQSSQLPATASTLPIGGKLGALRFIVGPEEDREKFPVEVETLGLTFGRTMGEVRFPDDPWVSGAHCKVHMKNATVTLMDLGSTNGTFLRFQGARALQHGDVLMMGQRLFLVQLT